ncbi:gliding motility-associated C-terminal domain-containing protein [Dyadobacter frigoris]|uniref:gliding motility-associated C-terminal domain-containing protein n=1 Tax=Dyadobacter frigoris TaxID=2576211 RepID=UPI0014852EBE|nr:gliding motility-associated C-terminal domain-containing protein [Dyadobacter frigoris]GLU53737.1 hypothetical protein Dfri01_31980 [Dyadobacter frigoris]
MFFSSLLGLHGQNLVPNPGFEQVKKRPCGIIPTDSPFGIQDYIEEWYTPTSGSSDVWYSDTSRICYPAFLANSRQLTRNGKMCAGLITSSANNLTVNNLSTVSEYREYIQVRLKQPMKKGSVYYAEYFAIRDFGSSLATNKLGAAFTVEPIGTVEKKKYPVIHANPQIVSNAVIKDTSQWTKISGCFIAADNYEYLTIGNFSDDRSTTFIPTFYTTQRSPYYLIDDILVEEQDVPFIPPTGFLGKDLVFCQDESYNFNLDSLKPYNFLWQDRNVNSNYLIKSGGEFSLTLSYKSCQFRDTVNVEVVSPVNLGPDLRSCEDNAIQLRNENGGVVKWQDETENSEFKVQNSGEFIAYSLSSQCPSSDTVKVELYPCPGIIPNVFTPNSDGKNDFFEIDHVTLSTWKLEVYNRWGKQIYLHENYDNTWDGNNLSGGMYYYVLSNPVLQKEHKGWVTIMK